MTHTIKKISKYRPLALQGTLQFAVGRPRVSLAMEHPLERRALSILTILFFVLAAGYLYFVASSILNVMARSDAMAHSRTIERSISTLEQDYLALSEGITPQRAGELGLAPVADTVYVYRPGNAAIAAENQHEI